jgi:cytochrome c oxidase subunit 4
MSTTESPGTDTESTISSDPHAQHEMPGTTPEATHEHGLSDIGYVKVAILLGVLTAIEVSTYYLDFGPLFMPTLIVLMVVKFFLVVAYFMHLKFDNRIFTLLFYSGVFLAIFVYVVALLTFEFFISA